jgi:flavodoxin
MEISILLGAGLFVSVAMNVVLIRLASWQSKDLTVVSENITDLVEIIENYRKHLKKVYELDSFYGDETLKFLMDHTNAMRALLEEQYGSVASITEPIEYQIGEDEDAEEESTEKEKHVLYAGSRRRDN